MSKRLLTFLLEDILEAIGRIEIYSNGLSRDSFVADRKAVDAVVRNLEIIGEAPGNLPQSYRGTHADIEWGQIEDPRAVKVLNETLTCIDICHRLQSLKTFYSRVFSSLADNLSSAHEVVCDGLVGMKSLKSKIWFFV
jgi:uncharacterized protein with HEPN domain